MRRMVTMAALALSACAAEDVAVGVAIPWPWSAGEIACAAGSLDTMSAHLHVAGSYPVCELTVDAGDHSASGECSGYRTGEELPLLVVYSMELSDPEAHTAILAVALGVADLRESVLPEGEEPYRAPIALAASDLVYQQYIFDGWQPGSGCVAVEGGTTEARARAWAWCLPAFHPDLFDGRGPERILQCRDPQSPDVALGTTPLNLACAGVFTSCQAPTY